MHGVRDNQFLKSPLSFLCVPLHLQGIPGYFSDVDEDEIENWV